MKHQFASFPREYCLVKIILTFVFISSICCSKIFATTYTITANQLWSAFGTAPTNVDIINVKNGATLTVDVANAAADMIQLGLGAGSAGNGTLAFNSGAQLTLSGTNGSLTLGTSSGRTGTLDMTNGGKIILKTFKALADANAFFTPGTGTVEITSSTQLQFNTVTMNCLNTFNNLIINGSGITVTTSINTTINNTLTLNSGNLTLGSTMTINGSAVFTSGYLTSTSTNLLTMNTGATTSGTSNSSHVIGPMAKNTNSTTPFTFPIGDGTYYRSLAITPQGTGATTYNAEYTYAKYSSTSVTGGNIDHVSKLEYWTLNRSGVSPQNCYITLSYNSRSKADTSFANLIVAHYNGSAWETTGTVTVSGDETSGTVTTNSYWNSFSPFTLGSRTSYSNLALPVTLTHFKISLKNNVASCEWQTQNETNNDYFTLERSTDGRTFVPIGEIKGAGTSSNVHHYLFNDTNPINGISYYRLKQTDFDNKYSYSTVISLDISTEKNSSIYPNPCISSLLYLDMPLINESYTYQIYNTTGKLLIEQLNFQNNINVSTLLPGIYILNIKDNNSILLTTRFIKE